MAAMLDLPGYKILTRGPLREPGIFLKEAKVRIRTGVVLLCRQLRSRSATLARKER
jgi:hypothetical protein